MTPLRQRMLGDMQVRNLSPHTQRAYIENVARFARHFGRSRAELGPEEIRTCQVYLIRERTLAPSSLEIAVCALRFLYKVPLKKPWSFDDQIPAPKKLSIACGRSCRSRLSHYSRSRSVASSSWNVVQRATFSMRVSSNRHAGSIRRSAAEASPHSINQNGSSRWTV